MKVLESSLIVLPELKLFSQIIHRNWHCNSSNEKIINCQVDEEIKFQFSQLYSCCKYSNNDFISDDYGE